MIQYPYIYQGQGVLQALGNLDISGAGFRQARGMIVGAPGSASALDHPQGRGRLYGGDRWVRYCSRTLVSGFRKPWALSKSFMPDLTGSTSGYGGTTSPVSGHTDHPPSPPATGLGVPCFLPRRKAQGTRLRAEGWIEVVRGGGGTLYTICRTIPAASPPYCMDPIPLCRIHRSRIAASFPN